MSHEEQSLNVYSLESGEFVRSWIPLPEYVLTMAESSPNGEFVLVVANAEKQAIIAERTQHYSVGDSKTVYVFSTITFSHLTKI